MLKAIKLSRPYTFKTSLMLFSLIMLMSISCGKRKPPLPPIERVPQEIQIQGLQRGNNVLLTWTMPARNAPDGNILNIDRVDIYRLAQPLSTTLNLTEEEFSSRSTLISSKKISENDFGLKKLSFTDKLSFAGQPARLLYAVRLVNSSGQKAAFSNFLLIEPTARVANTPSNVSAEITEPAIIIKWTPPDSNVDGSSPANILGFNIYRIDQKNQNLSILNENPIDANKFSDESFVFGKDYQYFVRTVSTGAEGESVESQDSNITQVSPKDVFPPSSPTSITIAAAPNNIAIFFATNPEKDIAGYTLYRTDNRNLSLNEWEKLTPELLTTNTFQDSKIVSGKTYYYYLTATDTAGNISRSSEIFFETAP